ncbi:MULTISPECIES: GNAT family N-acetyltransferase [Shewanella]|uniref:GNAT family N-acetyltransferase n=1 Tax=Shewanella TaxID=22 RepID=UPI001C65F0B6|nr:MULTISPECIES: GNAT family N-acetyltransferase [Shewanella]QYJ75885.1 GNAT family N-acetyltransferase [Shewanella sp. FJAT-52076]QYK05753.1 GNAT family N-acetyltransferase [Shewanella zhangzhouensis]
MHIASCQFEQHGAIIQHIFNHAIANTTALYEYEPRDMARIAAWFAQKEGAYPVLGAFDEKGDLMGFASYGPFRGFPANLYSVEHSVYVHPDHRGKGVALQLMQALIQAAKDAGLHMMVGGIDASNNASIALHQKLGFEHAGTLKEVGYKFDRWLDLAFYQLKLSN